MRIKVLFKNTIRKTYYMSINPLIESPTQTDTHIHKHTQTYTYTYSGILVERIYVQNL